jgi:hypothetical protein
MAKKKRRNYEPRIFEGREMTPADLRRLHNAILGLERIRSGVG